MHDAGERWGGIKPQVLTSAWINKTKRLTAADWAGCLITHPNGIVLWGIMIYFKSVPGVVGVGKLICGVDVRMARKPV